MLCDVTGGLYSPSNAEHFRLLPPQNGLLLGTFALKQRVNVVLSCRRFCPVVTCFLVSVSIFQQIRLHIFSMSSNRFHIIGLVFVMGVLFAVSMAVFIDPDSTLHCHLREYTHKVYRKDSLGRKCWDTISLLSCWGRCDTYEIADWQFPFKISHHPVCMHGERKLRKVDLRHCEANVEPGTQIYEFYEAADCKCQMCRTSHTNCQGLYYHDDMVLSNIQK